jgi:transposase-like protein
MAREWRVPPEKRHAVVEQYQQGLSLREVAASVGVNYKTARKALEDAGIEVRGMRPGAASSIHRQRSAVARWYGWHADWVEQQLDQGCSVEDIAKEAGFPPDLLRRQLARSQASA